MKNKPKFKLGTRVLHPTEANKKGMVLTVSHDETEVYVQWDGRGTYAGGIAQWVDAEDLKVAGYIL